MLLIDIVQQLISEGHKITFRIRTDGGIIVTSVDNKKTGITEGNKLVREMAGESGKLSVKREAQTSYNVNKFIKLKEGEKRLKQGISEDLEKKLKKIQRMSRKRNNAQEVRVTKKKLRWYVKEYGEKRASEYLQSRERYLQGFANFENINYLEQRLERMKGEATTPEEISAIDGLIQYIEAHKETFREEWITPCYEAIYNRSMSIKDRVNAIYNIIKK